MTDQPNKPFPDPDQPSAAAPLADQLKPPLDPEPLALLQPADSPRQFLNRLIEHEHFLPAITLLAASLPIREAIWWACLCIREHGDPPTPLAADALLSAERWTADPSEENRRLAQTAAEALGAAHPA